MSSIKGKPQISKREVKIEKTVVEGDINFFMYKQGGYKKHRVEGGWKYYTGTTWLFVPDEIVEDEIILDEGGLLDLSDRNVETLDEVFGWYSNNELDTILTLNLSNNSISDISDLKLLKHAKEVNLNSNSISDISDIDSLTYIQNIIVTNNPIAQSEIDLPISFTREEISACSQCLYPRGRFELEVHENLCKSCYDEQKKEIDDKYTSQIVRNNEHLQNIFSGTKSKKTNWFQTIIFLIVGYIALKFLIFLFTT